MRFESHIVLEFYLVVNDAIWTNVTAFADPGVRADDSGRVNIVRLSGYGHEGLKESTQKIEVLRNLEILATPPSLDRR